MMISSSRLALTYSLLLATSSFAQVTIAPLATFGGGDGWLAPGEGGQIFLGLGNFERGIDYNPTPNHLYLVSRASGITVRILDAATGAETGTLNTTGINTGATTFGLNKIVVADDGVIYGAGLRTGTTNQVYRIYRWDTEASLPTLVFETNPLGNGSRLGDDLDVIGSGAATRLVAGYGTGGTPEPAGINGYIVVDPTASAPTPTTPSFTNVMFAGTPPNTGDFRQGITFLSAGISGGTVLGTQGGTGNPARLSDYAGSIGTLLASPALQNTQERPMDFAVVGGLPLLATLEVTSTALATAGTVRLYDMTNPAAPVFLTSGNTQNAPFANANVAGDVRWGLIAGNTATIFAMNTNTGIEAFTVTVPEPSTAALLALGAGAVLRRRRY